MSSSAAGVLVSVYAVLVVVMSVPIPVVASTIGIIAVVGVWGVAFDAFPTLTQKVMLRAAGDATDAATALVNATTNLGIAGGALLGSWMLGVAAVPQASPTRVSERSHRPSMTAGSCACLFSRPSTLNRLK